MGVVAREANFLTGDEGSWLAAWRLAWFLVPNRVLVFVARCMGSF